MYGSYDMSSRKLLWQDLRRLGRNVDAPWLIQGDFNAVLSNGDKIGGIPINIEATNDFQECLLNLDLQEAVPMIGPRFTQTNFQEGV